MRSKIIGLFCLSILVLVLLAGLTSAVPFTLSASGPVLTRSNNVSSFTVTANESVNFTTFPSTATISDSDGNNVSLSITPSTILTNVNNATFSVVATSISENFNLGRGFTTVTINAVSGSDIGNVTVTLNFREVYCRSGDLGNDNELEILSVEDKSEGDPWEWEPLKDIKLVVEVGNNNQDDSKRVTVEVGVYDVGKEKFISLNDGEDKELDDSVRISDDDEEKFTFEFKLPADITENDEYILYVKAYEKGDEDVQCVSQTDFEDGDSDAYFQDVEVILDNEVGIDELEYDETVLCGSTNSVGFKLYNFDLEDDELMRVKLYNSVLGISLYSEQFELDNGDSEELFFDFNIPVDAEEKTHRIAIITEYNYKESTDVYKESNTDTDNAFYVRVEGGCTVEPSASVSVTPESEAKAGEDLVVKVSVTNTADKTMTYTLNAAGYTLWASSAELTLTTLTLNAGQSADVFVTFDVNKDAEGENLFDFEIVSDNELVLTQSVLVLIEGKSRFGFLTGSTIRENPYIWGIGLINLILIIVIVIVAVRLARK